MSHFRLSVSARAARPDIIGGRFIVARSGMNVTNSCLGIGSPLTGLLSFRRPALSLSLCRASPRPPPRRRSLNDGSINSIRSATEQTIIKTYYSDAIAQLARNQNNGTSPVVRRNDNNHKPSAGVLFSSVSLSSPLATFRCHLAAGPRVERCISARRAPAAAERERG